MTDRQHCPECNGQPGMGLIHTTCTYNYGFINCGQHLCSRCDHDKIMWGGVSAPRPTGNTRT